ncbi:MAG: class C sortase [Coriobacteriales bacterium]|jgi:sortase A|nr:class C sortase [Coriobacteriales bacterium]
MRKAISVAVALILLLSGLGILLYPQLLDWRYRSQVAVQKSSFLTAVALSSSSASNQGCAGSDYEQLYQYLLSENRRLAETGQSDLCDALSYQQPSVDLRDYGLEDDCIGFISLPSIDVELPIYLGANQDNMAKGAVHLTNTSYPIGGTDSNCVIAAHRGATLPMFRDIHKLAIGDEVLITNFREQLVYRVVQTRIISPTDVDSIKIQPGRDLVTLSSCNPLGANYQRYLVYCERVSTSTGDNHHE